MADESTQLKSSIGLTTSTFMSKDEVKKVSQLLQGLLDTSDSAQFRDPVPWKELNLLDYPSVVKYPMDLGTVKKNLTLGNYQTVENCLDDIQLIWDNCKAYNTKGTWIYNLADKLQKNFKKMIKNYLSFITSNMKKEKKEKQAKKKQQKKVQIKSKMIEVEQPEPMVVEQVQPLSLQQKTIYIPRRQFLYRAAHCTTDQMGILFLLIRNNSPHAFKVVDGKVMIQSQLINDTLLKRLQGQLDMWGVGLESYGKKR